MQVEEKSISPNEAANPPTDPAFRFLPSRLCGFAGGTAYASSKFALSGLTECWRAELRKHDIRVMQINPSEVQTAFFRGRAFSERKLRGEEIAHAIIAMLSMDDRGFTTEMSVWATNPD